jgi:hypothetical protein
MSEVETKDEQKDLQALKNTKYSKELRADCLNLYIKGYGSRQARRILALKYKRVPDSSNIRQWFRRYSEEIKEARGVNRDMEVLTALEAEGDYLEDISDDFLRFAAPAVIEGGEEKFKKLSYKDQVESLLKEINNKSRRNEAKILRLDPKTSNVSPLQIFIQQAQARKKELDDGQTTEGLDGIAADGNVIDVEFVEG